MMLFHPRTSVSFACVRDKTANKDNRQAEMTAEKKIVMKMFQGGWRVWEENAIKFVLNPVSLSLLSDDGE